MKARVFAVCAVIFLFCGIVNAGINDDFNNSQINTSIWSTKTPRADSGVFVENGFLVLKAMGNLDSVNQFDPDQGLLTIELTAKTSSPYERFHIFIRGDKTIGPNYINNGIEIGISTGYIGDGCPNPNVGIGKNINGIYYPLAGSRSMPCFNSGQLIKIKITDDGNDINVYINDKLEVSAVDSAKFSSNYITFVDRPNDGWMNNSTYIDYIKISQGTCSNSIVTFTAGTPAKAADVNANFDALNCQIQALKAIVCKNEPTASVCQ
jgi:hypothetical protein